jgi:hypothetical protein
MEIPYDQLGGIHSLTSILTESGTYAADHGGNAFKRPVRLPLYDGSIEDNATTVVRIQAEVAHKARLDDYASYSWVILPSNAKTFVLPSPPSMSPKPIA